MAQQAEAELCGTTKNKSRRDRGPLHGIPISLKDNIYTKDVRTTGGSQILKEFVPLHDAPIVRSLKKAGAVILGKTNMHEFAYGVTTENLHFGLLGIHGISSASPAAPAVARPRRWPRACATEASGPTPAGRSAYRLRCAE